MMLTVRPSSVWGLLSIATIVVSPGCITATPWGGVRQQEGDLDSLIQDGKPWVFGGSSRPTDADLVVVGMIFDVERVSVPAGASSERLEMIWKHVDELRFAPATTTYLLRNGFRMGVIRKNAVQDLRTVFEGLGARQERMTHAVRSGYPLTLDLGPLGPNSSVFTYGRNGRLTGKTFAGGSRRLHVDYAVEVVRDEPRIRLRLTPEIFKETDQPHWQAADGRIEYEKQYQGRFYGELSVELTTGPNEVLVVGPVGPEENRLIIGNVLLSNDSPSGRWTTYLFIESRLHRFGTETNEP